MKELESFSPVTYTYRTNLDKDFEGNIARSGKRGRPGLEQLQFYSKRLLKNDNTSALQKKTSVKMQLNDRVYEVFTQKLNFSNTELSNNIQILTDLQKMDLEAFLEFLDRNVPSFIRSESPRAYTIGALKNYYRSLRQAKERQTTASVAKKSQKGEEPKLLSELIGDL